MKAHLVYIDLLVRVVVPDDATEDEIQDAAADKAVTEARQDGGWSWMRENISDWKEDTEVPADEENDHLLEQQELSDFAQDDYVHNPEPENFI